MEIRERLNKQVIGHKPAETKTMNLLGFDLKIYPNVFVPNGTSSGVMQEYLNDLEGNFDLALDMGCGSGIVSLLLSKRVRRIIAADINENALKTTKENLSRNKISNVEVRKSNIFENIPEKFDLIIFNPPFIDIKPNSVIESAFTDENFTHLKDFFRKLRNHLKKNGKLILEFADMGGEKFLQEQISKYNYKSKEIYSKKTKDFAGVATKYYILEITV